MSYIIDFERLNELTGSTSSNDGVFPVTYGNPLSRSILKEYMDMYLHRRDNVSRVPTKDKIDHIIKTLVYNRILIGEYQLRDKKIDDILS